MSLEEKIEALTKAIEANTAALKGGGGKSTGGGAASGGATKGKHTKAEMQAALEKLKQMSTSADAKAGLAAAKTVIAEKGGVSKMAEIGDDPKVIDAVFDAATAKIAELEVAAEDDV